MNAAESEVHISRTTAQAAGTSVDGSSTGRLLAFAEILERWSISDERGSYSLFQDQLIAALFVGGGPHEMSGASQWQACCFFSRVKWYSNHTHGETRVDICVPMAAMFIITCSGVNDTSLMAAETLAGYPGHLSGTHRFFLLEAK